MLQEIRHKYAQVSAGREGVAIFIGDPGETSLSDDFGAQLKKRYARQ